MKAVNPLPCLVAGGMPAPEQASLVEEGQPQTHTGCSPLAPHLEPETTATTAILASVKEQVPPLILDFAINLFFIAFKINLGCVFNLSNVLDAFTLSNYKVFTSPEYIGMTGR